MSEPRKYAVEMPVATTAISHQRYTMVCTASAVEAMRDQMQDEIDNLTETIRNMNAHWSDALAARQAEIHHNIQRTKENIERGARSEFDTFRL